MQINLRELKHFSNLTKIEKIKNIEIILPAKITDKIINKYLAVFEATENSENFIDSLSDIICFTLTRYESDNVEYWITNIVDEDGIGFELDITKELFYEILKNFEWEEW